MPSAKVLESKKAIVADLTAKIQNAKAGVIVNYQGITVENDTALRKALREAGVDYKVYKNTLTGMACQNAGYDVKSYLEGMSAIALSNTDEVAAAKIMKEYADKIPSFEIKCGFVDGGVLDAEGVNALAAIPAKPVLVGKILGGMMSPVSKLAMVLQAIIDKENGPAEEAPAAE